MKPKGFWHASTKWGLRTKDPAPRVELVGIRVAMTKTRRANPLIIILEQT
ncbi:MAG: hypothetical protein ACNYPD_07980 [Candidatus Halichondribacter symbioticus]